MYSDIMLYIDGVWHKGSKDDIPVVNPATEATIGHVAHCSITQLDEALSASQRGFNTWRHRAAFDRSKIMRRSAELLRSRSETIAPLLSMEQGKPLAEAKAEVAASADLIEWFAEEGRRNYGRTVPGRRWTVTQLIVREPLGPVAAFTPWNFPIGLTTYKIGAALSSGCSIIVKGPEEAPAGTAELVRAFADAGVDPGALNLVFGTPAEISEYLIASPAIRKVSFTGSTPVGRRIGELAGRFLKPATLELGGHAPVLLFPDADVDSAINILASAKFRNAGQICAAPSRFIVHESMFEAFTSKLVERARAIKVGDGMDPDTTMGPIASLRRVNALESAINDAVQHGADVRTGGRRIGNRGYFLEPTVLTDVAVEARLMNEEPFGPIAMISPFQTTEDALAEANRLPYGLASYAFTKSIATVRELQDRLEAGMISINHYGLALPELPFGGVKASCYGSDGGKEAIDGYVHNKLISFDAA
ncbi:NAD-dependent succinate-semialdehyde dehydrogenase [Rhizobium sp. BK251]|uniref:NAD-dependent succinate-semialdehyde dehydrogenase n=1 Tax=Rhizobium sp. BK251 TaxID=2512125 RepID=UPI001043BBFC|nr:NAD-dependent succinate-semialdehyde dehydrogenase [Rhizobium sp. BK251]TCL64692.1 succinate-semialdehyde dehydrogenase/glutarate-semialdehyde dehydrogenase [Rhizobium sp. BK251]